MKLSILAFLMTAICFTYTNLAAQKLDSLSYAAGIMAATYLKDKSIEEVNVKDLTQAINDFYNDETLKIDKQTANQLLKDHKNKIKMEQNKATIEAGKKFLEENGKRPEVTTTESGLQYEVLKAGKGEKPAASSRVTVHYSGTLIDGTLFDSSIERGQPATFPVGGVIKGWVEALQLMEEGSKWKLFIPYDLAYGERRAGPKIPPFSTLIFEVELLKIN